MEDAEETFEEAHGEAKKGLKGELTMSEATNDTTMAESASSRQDESVQLSLDQPSAGADERGWDEDAKERFETAVFTLATFAAVFAVYIYIVYSLSSPPTVLHRV
ncbi:unnamed protein product [Xylocopa violacea]|uniref:Uncharacterized protein n=1 Tax=Xylocopa violacea TaxID=135666 RepID=A0ABP1P5T4_XYLVO